MGRRPDAAAGSAGNERSPQLRNETATARRRLRRLRGSLRAAGSLTARPVRSAFFLWERPLGMLRKLPERPFPKKTPDRRWRAARLYATRRDPRNRRNLRSGLAVPPFTCVRPAGA